MKLQSYLGPILGFALTPIMYAVHDIGHYIGAKLVGGNPEFLYGNFTNLEDYSVRFNFTEYSIANDIISLLSAPVAEYSFALVIGYLGRKLERTKHDTLKDASKFLSSLGSWFPFIYSVQSYMTNSRDYQRLADLGLPYNITIPITLLLGVGFSYYNFKEELYTIYSTLIKEKSIEK